jgi:hypothetical protein
MHGEYIIIYIMLDMIFLARYLYKKLNSIKLKVSHMVIAIITFLSSLSVTIKGIIMLAG